MRNFILFCITVTCFVGSAISNANSLPYEAIFNFGDSISDTGNAATEHRMNMNINSPYGSTYFKHESGRMSNGRLIIDFLADAYGLPFLPAYLNLTNDQDMKKGVNFAFAGATAIEFEYFLLRGLQPPTTNNSLRVQLDWFNKLKPSLCKSKQECESFFKNSLFIVGEIGGNDVGSVLARKNITELREMVPLMVEIIINTTDALIEEGAVELAVPGNFPIGCSAVVNSEKKEDYDQFGCLIAYNTLVEYFNEQLKNSLETLRQKHPQVKIIYFDYYTIVKRFFQEPQQYGFTSERNDLLKACFGNGGPYNVILPSKVMPPPPAICSDPSKRIYWDGAHLTEAAYMKVAKGLVEGPFANPSLKSPPFKIA